VRGCVCVCVCVCVLGACMEESRYVMLQYGCQPNCQTVCVCVCVSN